MLVSVIVPIYNVKQYVRRCVESILNQTYKDLEIILVDDGSTDGCELICDEYAGRDKRVKVVHKANGGLSDARNAGLRIAVGDCLGFVDGDDWIHPQMYEIMISTMKNENADIVTCGFEKIDEMSFLQPITCNKEKLRVIDGAEAIINIDVPKVMAWNKLYRRDVFDGIWYPKGKLHEDEYVIHKLFYKCKKIAVLEEKLYFYVTRNSSIISNINDRHIDDALEALENRIQFSIDEGWKQVIPAMVRRYCDYCIDMYYAAVDGVYELSEAAKKKLVYSERKIIEKYHDIPVESKYRLFAKNIKVYEGYIRMLKVFKNLRGR